MAGRGKQGKWLQQVPIEARTVITQIVQEHETYVRGDKDRANQWWLRCPPTTGTHTDITLLRKVDGITVRERPIMRKGKLVDPNGE